MTNTTENREHFPKSRAVDVAVIYLKDITGIFHSTFKKFQDQLNKTYMISLGYEKYYFKKIIILPKYFLKC